MGLANRFFQNKKPDNDVKMGSADSGEKKLIGGQMTITKMVKTFQ